MQAVADLQHHRLHAHSLAPSQPPEPAPALPPLPAPPSQQQHQQPATTTDADAGPVDGQQRDSQAGPVSKKLPQPTKLFRCNGFGDCQMTFTRSEHLARHVRKHTGERPFQCHCGRQFSRLDNVRQHASTVHADQQEKNQETIANLVALHNKLSATTVAKQKEAGMIVHDQQLEARPPKRKAETAAAAGGRGAEPKPKKSAGGKKKGTAAQKAKEQADAAAELGQQIAGDLDRIASQPPPVLPNPPPVQSVSPYEPPNPAARSSPRGGPQPPIPPPGPATYPYAAPPQYPSSNYANYNSPWNAYYGGGAPVPYTQMYGGAAPGNAGMGGGGYPGMDYYGAYPPQAGPSGVSSAPQAPQYYSVSPLPTPPAQHDRARYTSNIPTSLPYPPVQPQAQADTGALTPNKISLPSISALMADPSPAAAAAAAQQGQQRADSDPNAQQQQQSYYAAMRASGGGGPNSRPPSTLGMPPPQQPQQPPPHHHHQQHPQQQQQYAYHHQQQQQHGEMQYHQHQHQQHQHQPHPQAMAAMYGLDPYARPGSTNGSEREGPPSLSNGSTSTASSFANGSPHHPHLPAPPTSSSHYSHLYAPARYGQPAGPASYHYAPPPPPAQSNANYYAPPQPPGYQLAPPPPPASGVYPKFTLPAQQGPQQHAMYAPAAGDGIERNPWAPGGAGGGGADGAAGAR